MASTAVNLSSQRISFVNKISLILKATSDDESPTPGYMYKEINDISFESVGYSDSLVEFLVDRLKNKSCHVRYKVLKLMKHLTENGSREFREGLRKQSDIIKESTKFGGPPHPLHGNIPYLMVRKVAKEVCESLYNLDPSVAKSSTNVSGAERPAGPKYVGMGPVQSGRSIQGFGNTPMSQSKGIGETILGGIEKLGAKMTETAADRQAALLAKLDLSSSSYNYQPPAVVSPEDDSFITSSIQEGQVESSSAIFQRPVKKRQPGKAGGGWGDDEDGDDEDGNDEDGNENNNDDSKQQSIETDSLADPASGFQLEDPQADWAEESALMDEILSSGSTGKNKVYLSSSTTSAFLTKCLALSCCRIVELLAEKLASGNAEVVIRTLQVLEGIIHNNEELISVDNLTSTCKEALASCYLESQSRLLSLEDKDDWLSSPSTCSNDSRNNSSEEDSEILWNAVQAKSAKIILILQQLSSHKDILPPASFKHFLSSNNSTCKTVKIVSN